MARKTFLIAALFSVILAGCGGGGSGNSSTPVGVNPNMPAIVQLLPVQYVAQTNSFITFKAKVLNGNGNVLPGVGVVFTKMSLLGVLSATYAVTDTLGFATVTVSSTTPGFTTVQAEVNTGTGLVRDKRTVFFTIGDLNIQPYIVLEVDGTDNDSTFNENEDFNLFENNDAADNVVNIRATVFTGLGLPIAGTTVQFGTDAPYRIGSDPAASCSDGSTACEVTFPLGNIATTDAFGEAFILIQVNPATLRNIATVLNVTAQDASLGAYNVLSLFLNQLTVGSVVLFANPTEINSGEDSTITAAVFTNLNTPVPDGTVVSFTVSGGGSITPVFSQTTNGMTDDITYTAPITTTNITATITGTSGGKPGQVEVDVVGSPVPPPTPAALSVTPAVSIVSNATCNVVVLSVTGGTTPYVANVTTPLPGANPFNDNGAGGGTAGDCLQNGSETSIWSGAAMSVTIPSTVSVGNIVITVNDAVAATDTATITLQP